MSARRRPPEPTGSPMRGAVLIAIAVVLGLVLLRNGVDTSDVTAAGSGSTRRTTTTLDPDAETTTTTVPLRPPAEVKVLIANGSGIDGAGRRAADALNGLGYITLEPGNAERVETTIVYYLPGYENEADALAAALGSPPLATVAALPPTPPIAPADANLVVVLGPDKATP